MLTCLHVAGMWCADEETFETTLHEGKGPTKLDTFHAILDLKINIFAYSQSKL